MFDWMNCYPDVKCIYVTDGSAMEKVTSECKLVSLNEFKRLVAAKKRQEQKEINGEGNDNG